MKKEVRIEIPPEINFLELGLHRADDRTLHYNVGIFEDLLEHNDLSIEMLTQDDVVGLIAYWYMEHIKNGGEPDMCAERMRHAVIDPPVFEPSIHWNAIVEPPTPEQIKDFRERTNMTQDQAASLLGLSNKRLIADYETGVSSPNPQTWTLWLLLTGQHPTLKLSER